MDGGQSGFLYKVIIAHCARRSHASSQLSPPLAKKKVLGSFGPLGGSLAGGLRHLIWPGPHWSRLQGCKEFPLLG